MNLLWLPITKSMCKHIQGSVYFTDIASVGSVKYAKLHELKKVELNLFVTTLKGKKVMLDDYLMLCSGDAFTGSELKEMEDPITAAGLLLAQHKATEVRISYKERLDAIGLEKETVSLDNQKAHGKLLNKSHEVDDLKSELYNLKRVIGSQGAHLDKMLEENKNLNEEITSLKTSEHEQKGRAGCLNEDNRILLSCLDDMGSKLEASEIEKQRLNQSISSIEESMSKNTCGFYDSGRFIAARLNGVVRVYKSFNEAAVAAAEMPLAYDSGVCVLKIVGETKSTVQVVKV